ncbi:MAG: Toxin-antitoxin system, toxin component, RelE family [Parcubacteria group bacterium GW2011_GWA2_56_7]|nr:MAG: Toxin-antitoxin system, toxin component, RelE family [Parcubacteria group bacterium GW2011_GWA2_56_7]
MPRQPRNEFPGAFFHVMSRGDHKQPVFFDSTHYLKFIEFLSLTIEKYNWICHSYCLMNNHYHILIETPEPNLGLGMHQLNAGYANWFNTFNDKSGHVFQGRYKSVLVQENTHLLELSRYIILNPVEAGVVEKPEDWVWSSCRAMYGMSPSPHWLTTKWLLGCFGQSGQSEYKRFVALRQEGDRSEPDRGLTPH